MASSRSQATWVRALSIGSIALALSSCDMGMADPSDPTRPSIARVQQGGTTLTIRPQVRRLSDGTVHVRVEAGCPAGLEVLEAFVTVSQTSGFGLGSLPVSCTGRTRKISVIVTLPGAAFEPGDAVVSGFLLAIDPATSETEQGQDTRTVVLR